MRRPRILILDNSTGVTGALKSVLEYTILLKPQFHFFFVLPTGSAGVSFVENSGFECVQWKMVEISRRLRDLMRYLPYLWINARRMTRLVNTLHVDGIVSNDFYNLIPVVYRLAGGKVPYLTFVRFIPARFPAVLRNSWVNMHRRYADQIIAVSKVVKEQLPADKKIRIIYAAVPLVDVASPPSQPGIVLYPANFTSGKGHEKALRSFASISAKFPAWKLRFVGSDFGLKKNRRFKDSLANEARTLGVAHQIEVADFVEDIHTEYIRAAFVLNFSDSESFSMTCLESLFFARPVIATRSGGPQEIIQHDLSGTIVDIDDIPAMTTAMEKLMRDNELVQRMGSFGAADVRRRFSVEMGINLMTDAYRKLSVRN